MYVHKESKFVTCISASWVFHVTLICCFESNLWKSWYYFKIPFTICINAILECLNGKILKYVWKSPAVLDPWWDKAEPTAGAKTSRHLQSICLPWFHRTGICVHQACFPGEPEGKNWGLGGVPWWQVKDLALSLLWHGFKTWPRNFHILQVQPKVKNKNQRGLCV